MIPAPGPTTRRELSRNMTNRRDRSGPQPLSKILPEVLRECGLDDRLEERSPILHWRRIVGEDIAAHSRAVDLSDGVLVLEADHGAWRQEVTMLIPMIRDKFNALFGEGTVTDIQWRDRPVRGRKRSGKK
jgi:predicted nucleic acid-binding Zn ribbon protein